MEKLQQLKEKLENLCKRYEEAQALPIASYEAELMAKGEQWQREDILRLIDEMQKEPKSGADLIAAERRRQMEAEGYSPEHDDKHKPEEFTMAAISYALPEWMRWTYKGECEWWPFEKDSFKPSPDDRVRELVKAGALIAAEIDRIQRTGIQYLYDEETDKWYLPGSITDKELGRRKVMTDEMSEAIEAMEADEPQANLYRAAEEYVSDLTRELVGIGDSDDFDVLVELMKQAVIYGAHWKERQLMNDAIEAEALPTKHPIGGIMIYGDLDDIKAGDKIKAIIIKTAEK